MTVSIDCVKNAASTIDSASVLAACSPFKYPCKFDNLEHEISFMATMRMLEFGSGFDHLLNGSDQQTSRGATQVCGKSRCFFILFADLHEA